MTVAKVPVFQSSPAALHDVLLQDANGSLAEFKQIIDRRLESPDVLSQIAVLSSASVSELPSYSFVRFRAMIQDNGLSPQMFLKSVRLQSTNDGSERVVPNYFIDDVQVPEGFTVVQPSFSHSELDTKQCYFCVNVPAESSWLAPPGTTTPPPAASASERMPISDSHSIAVVVKVPGEDPQFKLNETVDFYGILEHPATACSDSDNCCEDDFDDFDYQGKLLKQHPCLTVVTYKRNISVLDSIREQAEDVDAEATCSRIRAYLTDVLQGDELAADYLLLHTLSKIRNRSQDNLGYFPINLTNVSPSSLGEEFASTLTAALGALLPKHHYLPLTLDKLEKGRVVPRLENDRGLLSGELQLTDGTLLIVDETRMNEGTLKERGLLNLKAIHGLIHNAALFYESEYTELEQHADLGIVVLSQGKSLFPIDCVIPVNPSGIAPDARTQLSEEELAQARATLLKLRESEYSVPEDMLSHVQSSIAEFRKLDRESGRGAKTSQDFLRMLEIARLLSKVSGEVVLTPQTWERAVEMEKQRLGRIEQLTRRA
ncbi:putative alanine racemase-domain-containing protein [Polychytrium aggregatum]|uniref:putative alanine racemase-domain-containing protein n=1 Tax=Polychytrium aggregatum TaxID=110093 RepID=UPI0022FE21E6|nr:putative alanine racemase-domain-containing protein [Polychytrium aggregatum]KAI9204080.1 putative alanine racemase-domain-containing protein [Polychytrium aggregatum]